VHARREWMLGRGGCWVGVDVGSGVDVWPAGSDVGQEVETY